MNWKPHHRAGCAFFLAAHNFIILSSRQQLGRNLHRKRSVIKNGQKAKNNSQVEATNGARPTRPNCARFLRVTCIENNTGKKFFREKSTEAIIEPGDLPGTKCRNGNWRFPAEKRTMVTMTRVWMRQISRQFPRRESRFSPLPFPNFVPTYRSPNWAFSFFLNLKWYDVFFHPT